MELKAHCKERFEPVVQAVRQLLEEKSGSEETLLVAIDGRIANRRWVDKQTNNERETFYVIANNIRLLGSKRDAETEAVL